MFARIIQRYKQAEIIIFILKHLNETQLANLNEKEIKIKFFYLSQGSTIQSLFSQIMKLDDKKIPISSLHLKCKLKYNKKVFLCCFVIQR